MVRGVIDKILDEIIWIKEKKKNEKKEYRYTRVIIQKVLKKICLLKKNAVNIWEAGAPKRKKID